MWRFACCYLLLHFNNVEVCLLLQVTTRLCAFHLGPLTSTSGSTLSTITRRTTTIWVSTSILIGGSNGALWRLPRPFVSISCSFREEMAKIMGLGPALPNWEILKFRNLLTLLSIMQCNAGFLRLLSIFLKKISEL